MVPYLISKQPKVTFLEPLSLTTLTNMFPSEDRLYKAPEGANCPVLSSMCSTAVTSAFKAAIMSGNACVHSLFNSCKVILILIHLPNVPWLRVPNVWFIFIRSIWGSSVWNIFLVIFIALDLLLTSKNIFFPLLTHSLLVFLLITSCCVPYFPFDSVRLQWVLA